MRLATCVAGFVFAIYGSAVSACGHCVEDKIAAVYDHAAVIKAKAQRHHVAFFAIDGKLVADEKVRRAIENMVRSTDAVDQESVRVSLDLAALSFSFDPTRASFAAVQNAIESKLASMQLRLLELRILDDSISLKTSTMPRQR